MILNSKSNLVSEIDTILSNTGSDNDVVTLGFIKKKKRKLTRNKKREDADWHHPRVKKKISYSK